MSRIESEKINPLFLLREKLKIKGVEEKTVETIVANLLSRGTAIVNLKQNTADELAKLFPYKKRKKGQPFTVKKNSQPKTGKITVEIKKHFNL